MPDQPQYPSYPGAVPPPPGPAPLAHDQAPAHVVAPLTGSAGVGVPYAGWWARVGAQLLDGLIVFAVTVVPFLAGVVLAFRDLQYDAVTDDYDGPVHAVGVTIVLLSFVLWGVFDLWNRGIRVGTTGRSLGKQIVGIRVVRADTGALLGAGNGFVRWLLPTVLAIVPCLGWFGLLGDALWPLWDDRNQTLHDKVVGSVALRT